MSSNWQTLGRVEVCTPNNPTQSIYPHDGMFYLVLSLSHWWKIQLFHLKNH